MSALTTNYDPIVEQYQRSKQQPWREFVECFTLMDLIGDPQGLDVLDVACGEGFYTRMMRQRGAARVTGVDLSEGMIELARRQEFEQRIGIDYLVADARNLVLEDKCDLVLAAYLLNYARTRGELQAMCEGIAGSLRPGGRFVTVNCNPALAFPTAPSYRKYGFETSVLGDWKEGTPIKWTFFVDEGPFEIENYHLSPAIHEDVLRAAGFRAVHWHTPKLSPEGSVGYEREYWSNLLDHPPVTFIECVK